MSGGMNIKRRDFLKLVGVSGAGLVLSSCGNKDTEKLVPFVNQPEDMVPGIPTFYASSCRECPAGCGLVVKTREGRVIKLEGNPAHPVNKGGLCARGHAGLQELYNADRLKTPMKKNGTGWTAISWDEAIATLAQKAKEAGPKTAALTGLETGSVDTLYAEWMKALGSSHHHRYEAFGFEPLREATRVAFGRAVVPHYDFEKARLVVSFGSDFLQDGPSPVAAARGMADARGGKADGQRFISFDSRPNLAAANADEMISIKPGSEMAVALGLLHVMASEGLAQVPGGAPQGYDPAAVEAQSGVKQDVLKRVAREFAKTRPGLAVAGGVATQGDNATALCLATHMLNAAVGAVGTTLNLEAGLPYENLSSSRDLAELAKKMAAKEIDLLVVHGPNPVFNFPKSLKFAEAIQAVPFKVAFARQMDETAELCDLVLPVSHSLESWDDAQPMTGVHNLMQPAMRPVFGTRSAGEVLHTVARQNGAAVMGADFLGYMQSRWKSVSTGGDFDGFWEKAVQSGGAWNVPAGQSHAFAGTGSVKWAAPKLQGDANDPVLMLVPTALMHDGRGANKSWMQELPDPVTKTMWNSWVEVSPALAKRLGVNDNGDLLEIDGLEEKLTARAYIHEGLRDDVVALSLGQGHTSYGRNAKDRGVNAFAAMRPMLDDASGAMAYLQTHVKLTRVGHQKLSLAQGGSDQMGRGIAQTVTIDELLHPKPRPKFEGNDDQPFGAKEGEEYVPKYKKEYEAHPLSGNPMMTKHRWGMAIDLDRCNGCSACITACYSENNIQIVGENEAWKRRDMGWIRIEKYLEKRSDGTMEVRMVPLACQQCDNAPCEYVCPVYATYHNPEGISAQIYNRCIGTRYCANNCPYRARKFNYKEPVIPEPLNWQLNPDVTVRSKGVMEKCSFCIQRIRAARDTAKDESRDIRDGEVVPACAQSCPTQAIVFGDQNDPASVVSKIAKDPRGYKMLEILNTQPNIHYLKRVRREAAKV